ncbi:MAG: hypothetical protein JWO87_2657 [Phycisphaerales bacterium]|nr:hypothetical protein [Phycisphaerales bacterium]
MRGECQRAWPFVAWVCNPWLAVRRERRPYPADSSKSEATVYRDGLRMVSLARLPGSAGYRRCVRLTARHGLENPCHEKRPGLSAGPRSVLIVLESRKKECSIRRRGPFAPAKQEPVHAQFARADEEKREQHAQVNQVGVERQLEIAHTRHRDGEAKHH